LAALEHVGPLVAVVREQEPVQAVVLVATDVALDGGLEGLVPLLATLALAGGLDLVVGALGPLEQLQLLAVPRLQESLAEARPLFGRDGDRASFPVVPSCNSSSCRFLSLSVIQV
jgi:hypothetical protein